MAVHLSTCTNLLHPSVSSFKCRLHSASLTLDRFKCQNNYVMSGEILQAVGLCISNVRNKRFKNVVSNRSYSVCLVVEGLSDFGNVSAVFRSADALGIQSVHVVSCDSSKRWKDN